ncbi:hypothetical protein CCAX7_28160 [Capsulimonas corticalis]|uniref:Uncharacterized protein n=1 Tax=Capsulimonas corticalis TaxID=2219043 RepID=A0A402CTE9_9BACT|nr:hypothetical protein [Capsulimonas corticalis]BDI30765.1 hypothetical protein CCAX7_28160 [Capsulimonas corticalis]
MTNAVEILRNLQARMAAENDPEWPDDYAQKLYFTESHGLIHVEYYGPCFDETYEEFLNTVCRSDVAPHLRSLALRGPDEGANGTRNWDLSCLAAEGVRFSSLNSFYIEPTAPEHHNHSIVAAIYEEEGQIAHAVAKMPDLKSLTVPSAPNKEFFLAASATLERLRIESGYNHQNFIQNLSESRRLPNLTSLDFGDYNQRNVSGDTDQCTAFSHYEQLFKSPAFDPVKLFTLRNSPLSTSELSALRKMRNDVQFFQIQSFGSYVR